MSGVLADTFDITVENETYTFRRPTIKYRMEVGARAIDIRRRSSAESIRNEQQGLLDLSADYFSRNCAVLELYLVRATTTWPYGTEDVGKIDLASPPQVDFEKFPADRDATVDAVGAAFVEALARFRAGRNTDGRPPGA